jgi:Ca2+/Na+ antiporter
MCLAPAMARPDVDHPSAGRPGVAVALIFGACVSCATLVLGVVTYIAPLASLPPSRKAWPFILPAALLALLAGFAGNLNWMHAGMFALLGVVVMNLWVGTHTEDAHWTDRDKTKTRPNVFRVVQLVLAVALSGIGGWAASRGIARAEQSSRILTGVLLASAVVAPLLTLPILGATAAVAERGRPDSAVSTLVAIVMINLCGVLPVVIVSHYAVVALSAGPTVLAEQPTTRPSTAPATLPTTLPTAATAERVWTVPYPLASWRVDTVILIVLGFAMIPWAIGRWVLTRAESLALIFAYAVYLGMTAFLAARWR